MEEEKIIFIDVDIYDAIFDEWISCNKIFLDQFNYSKRLKEFDNYMGLSFCYLNNSNSKKTDSDYFTFKVENGPKFLLAQLKYDLNL